MKRFIGITLITLLFFLLIYLGWIYYKSSILYVERFQGRESNAVNQAITLDRELGHKNNPNTINNKQLGSKNVRNKINENGFRIGDNPQRPSKPSFICLGDSFVYGKFCQYEETFTHKLSQNTGMYGMNAGVNGYGLCQMLLSAKMLIPEHKPDIVITQFSDWLISRSVNPFEDVKHGKFAKPFFYKQDGVIKIHGPMFTAVFPKLVQKKGVPSSALECFLEIGIPLYFHDDAVVVKSEVKQYAMQSEEMNFDEIVLYVYSEIKKLCDSVGARHYILHLNGSLVFKQKAIVPPFLLKKDNFIDAFRVQLELLKPRTYESFVNAYAHIEGGKVLDEHPNPYAHSIIAEVIKQSIY